MIERDYHRFRSRQSQLGPEMPDLPKCRICICIVFLAALLVPIPVAGYLYRAYGPATVSLDVRAAQGGLAMAVVEMVVIFVAMFPIRLTRTQITELRRQRHIIHFTEVKNCPSIGLGGTVCLRSSRLLFTNTANFLRTGRALFTFRDEPRDLFMFTNLCGRDRSQRAKVLIPGANLPDRIYRRLIDNTLMLPGGYRGPGTIVLPDSC